jgi:RimJ/RimL family protein N-acetyltransferase
MNEANGKKNRVVFLRGAKCALGFLDKTDAPDLTRWINAQRKGQRNLMISLPYTEMQEENWIERIAENQKKQKEIVLAIETFEGKFIGTIGLHRINWKDRTAVTGMLIGEPDYREKGYGTDAKMALLDYAFNTLNLWKICSGALAFNVGSQRCLEKCGYQREGVRRKQFFRNGEYHDEIMFGLFKEEWLEAKRALQWKPKEEG